MKFSAGVYTFLPNAVDTALKGLALALSISSGSVIGWMIARLL